MCAEKTEPPSTITALIVRQWLPSWDNVQFDANAKQEKPAKRHFYLFSIKAGHLKALTGVYRRSTKGAKSRSKDPNVQRGHEEERSKIIREFVQYGYPWCEMNEAKREMAGADDLRKPGWLPTAILINVLPTHAERNGVRISEADLMRIEDRSDNTAIVHLPKDFTGSDWAPKDIYPLEVIDGQHRLWAFDNFDLADEFELPVVAFTGLDRGWQAYLFWSVNITPKKINRSLAFDLYPLLRHETWLDKFAGHSIYRETRCQELVEALWAHPESPWHQKINMLGETKTRREYKGLMVTQAAWVRSLTASFVKQWEGVGTKIGGLFGAPPKLDAPLLPWSRPMQAAFLIYAGNALKNSVRDCQAAWAVNLRNNILQELIEDDQAFYGDFSLVSTDQGIRGFLFILNDLCYIYREKLSLEQWRWENVADELQRISEEATDEIAVTAAIKTFSKTAAAKFVTEIAEGLSSFDWRLSSTPGLTEEVRMRQANFRGGPGYKEIRRQMLHHLANRGGVVGRTAEAVAILLDYK